MNAQEARATIAAQTKELVYSVNATLAGRNLTAIRPILRRIDSTGAEPHWFSELHDKHRLPNLDGKTVGSVIEKLTVCSLEKFILKDCMQLSVNPAKGIDIPELDLGIKSPSTNFCTSEPFFSAYDRLLGNESDALILLTNYQSAKNDKRNFNLHIIDARYLKGSEIADQKLCAVAKNVRKAFANDSAALQTLFRFIAYVNQGDWEANALLKLLEGDFSSGNVASIVDSVMEDGMKKNRKERHPDRMILQEVFDRLLKVKECIPAGDAVVRAVDSWVVSNLADSARYPSPNELKRLMVSPLDGKIGMSFALQWRYNFSSVFPQHRKGE
ncbi:MAG: hypothetical protein IJS32_09030 [Kiritimatiellae bacterium]|nr:hypothetical protein [Kiritimatiellia bacterium]